MAREREVKVTVLGDSSSGRRALSQLDDQATRTGNHFDGLGGKIASFGKIAALGLAGAAVGIGALLKSSAEAAEESRKVAAQTEAVIKSTGGAANVSADQVGRYADKLAALTGIDDEVIAGGQNMLLTFTRVRNEAGKGNDIFDQATKSALNMSVALGTDLNSASMLVGKALNDPIAGLTALTRSGIQFTAQQKEQIKAMVAAGDTLGAQKIILKELETQFGGSAEAAASPLARLKVVVGNLQEELGARFLPVIGKVAGFLADKLPPALDAVGRGLSLLKSGFSEGNVSESSGFMGFLVNVGTGVRELVDKFKEWWPKIKETVLAAVDAIVGFVKDNWPEIRKTITDVMKTVQTVVKGVIDIVTTIWRNFGDQITAYTQNAFHAAMDIIQGALAIIRGIVQTVTSLIKGDWSGAWDGIKQILAGAWQAIQGIIDQAMNYMRTTMSIGMETVAGVFGGAWDAIFEVARNAVARIVDTFLGMVGHIIHAADSAFGWIPGIGDKLHDARVAFDNFRDSVNESIRGIVPNKTVTINLIEAVSRENDYNTGTAGDPSYNNGPPPTAQLEQYAIGMEKGPIPGRRDQIVPINAHGGEWVVTPEQMARIRGAGASGGDGAGSYAGGGGWSVAPGAIIIYALDPKQAALGVRDVLISYGKRVPGLGLDG